MSLSNNYPNAIPSLVLDFANTKKLDPRVTFTRASTGTFYDGKTVAKAEENLLLRSQEFNDSFWSQGVTNLVTANTAGTTAPDGTNTAELFTDQAVSSVQRVFGAATLLASTRYVFSLFVKNITRQYVSLAVTGATSNYFGATYDLVGATVTATRQAGTGFAHVSSSITSVGNDWYRIVLIGDTGTTVSSSGVAICLNTTGTPTVEGRGTETYIGDGSQIYAWGAQLEQRSSVTAYTATTTAPITNYIPALQTAASGVARFEHNPVTGESLGLEIEEQRTNLATRSEEFNDAAWTKTRASVTANTIIAPDGTLTGDKLVEDTTASNTHIVFQSVTTAAGTYTWSVYAKAAERNWVCLNLFSASSVRAWFNLSTGVVGTVGSGLTASITSVGNGWYRCAITRTTTDTNHQAQINLADADNSSAYTGDGYKGIYIWGAQLEAGAFATSYIKTEGSQVTRNADSASMTGTNFSSWYRADEGTVYSESLPLTAVSSARVLSISDNTATNRMMVLASNIDHWFVTSSGTNVAALDAGAYSTTTTNKQSSAYAVNDFAASINSGTVATDTSGSLPVGINRLYIGANHDGTALFLNGTIKKLAYYPKRLSSAELQGLTTV